MPHCVVARNCTNPEPRRHVVLLDVRKIHFVQNNRDRAVPCVNLTVKSVSALCTDTLSPSLWYIIDHRNLGSNWLPDLTLSTGSWLTSTRVCWTLSMSTSPGRLMDRLLPRPVPCPCRRSWGCSSVTSSTSSNTPAKMMRQRWRVTSTSVLILRSPSTLRTVPSPLATTRGRRSQKWREFVSSPRQSWAQCPAPPAQCPRQTITQFSLSFLHWSEKKSSSHFDMNPLLSTSIVL